jgi:hypothetical protein
MSIEAMKQAYAVPLIEQLESVPADARMMYEHDKFHHENIPVGRLCHEAATALRQAIAEAEKQEPVVGTKTWFEDGKMVTQHLHPSDIYKDQPDLARVGEVGVWGDGQALEEPANFTTDFVEPVAWIEKHKDYLAVSADPFENAIPVYTAPPKREWVGLTDEERLEVASRKWWHWEDAFDIGGFARAIEAKLKEKNA